MKIDSSIKVKNYKCFNSKGGGFEKILPINIIIGKNNSGKSSLIDLIKYLIDTNNDFLALGRDNIKAEVVITQQITRKPITQAFSNSISGGGIPGNKHLDYGQQFINSIWTYNLQPKHKKKLISIDKGFVDPARKYFDRALNYQKAPLEGKIFCNITAERDIIPEISINELKLDPNGTGATNFVQNVVNKSDYDSRLIEIKLLDELNNILKPDIEFSRILLQEIPNQSWEIYFEDKNNIRIALSKMGSGIKTILIVLLNLIVRPIIENRGPHEYVFAFEELENNLHPSLQRRLYNFIREYSSSKKTYFFISTHSNIVIDAFGTFENSQLIHITIHGDHAITTTVLSFEDNKNILNDLDVKASDLLQSNGIIWVEGPSDRNYINKWISLVTPLLKEGLHYSIMFYGGKLLSNLTFDYDSFNKEVIPLLKLNTNAFVVMDRDGKTIGAKLNETKKRIQEEIGEKNFWITKGREIENYISSEIISKWLKESYKIDNSFQQDPNQKIEENIKRFTKKIRYNMNKTHFSLELVKYFDRSRLNILDLRSRLNSLTDKIKQWNSINDH